MENVKDTIESAIACTNELQNLPLPPSIGRKVTTLTRHLYDCLDATEGVGMWEERLEEIKKGFVMSLARGEMLALHQLSEYRYCALKISRLKKIMKQLEV